MPYSHFTKSPIYLVIVVSKLLEKVVYIQLFFSLTNNLNTHQSVFCSPHSKENSLAKDMSDLHIATYIVQLTVFNLTCQQRLAQISFLDILS